MQMWVNRTTNWLVVISKADVIITFGPNTGMMHPPKKTLATCPTKAAAAMSMLLWRSKTGLKGSTITEFHGDAVRRRVYGNDWKDEGEE